MTVGTPQNEARTRVGIELVNEILRSFKVRRLYDVQHPQRRESEEASASRIAALLEESGPVHFVVEGERMSFEGETVYDQPEGRESLAFLLYREGLRQISFFPGVTGEEMGMFLDEVAAASLAGSEEEFNLVARLWERNFVHIRYVFVEQLMDEEWSPPAAEEAPLVIGRDETPIVLHEEDRSAADFLREVDPTLYFLDDEDMAALQNQLESEKERTLLGETLTCLREILLVPAEHDVKPIFTAIADIHAAFIEEGSFDEVTTLHDVFEPYLESPRATDDARAMFVELAGRALDETALIRLATQVDTGAVDERAAARYYAAFGSGNLATLLARCGDIKRLCQRAGIAEAFLDLARADASALRAAILDEDPMVACPAAFLAGVVGDGMFLEPLSRALTANDHQIRREALSAVKQIGGPRSLDVITRAVEDPDATVRLYALRHLVSHRYAPALPRVSSLLDKSEERSLTERRLLYEAYGALGGDAVVDDLAKRLKRRGLLRKTDPEEAACVLIALGAVGTGSARVLVEEAALSRQTLVQRTAAEVLQTWDGTAGRR